MPRCYDCLTEDVTVKLIDQHGFEHWFCAEDWADHEQFGETLTAMLERARLDTTVPPGLRKP